MDGAIFWPALRVLMGSMRISFNPSKRKHSVIFITLLNHILIVFYINNTEPSVREADSFPRKTMIVEE